MTILYNDKTGEIVGRYAEGYTIDGVLQPLGEIDGLLHLEYVTNPMPDYDTETHRMETSWKVIKNTYAQTWQIIPLTTTEIWLRGWHEPDYEVRIVAPKSLVFDDMGAKMFAWFQLNGLPVHPKDKDNSYLYCTEILPEHQPMLDAFQQQGVVVEPKKHISN